MAANKSIQTPDSPGLGIPCIQNSLKNYTLDQDGLKPKIVAQISNTLHMNHMTVLSYTPKSHVTELCSTTITVKTSEGIFNQFFKHKEIQAQLGKVSQLKYSYLPALEYEMPSCVLSLELSMSVHVRMQHFCRVRVMGGGGGQYTYIWKISNDI
jgi:hypothetical protein